MVRSLADHVAVMYLGTVAEFGPVDRVFAPPYHPYTEALLSAVPVPDPTVKPNRIILQGDVPSPIKPPPGCHFHTRCPLAFERCKVERPLMRETRPNHFAACHLREGEAVQTV